LNNSKLVAMLGFDPVGVRHGKGVVGGGWCCGTMVLKGDPAFGGV